MSWFVNVLPVTLYFSNASSAISQTSNRGGHTSRTGGIIRSQPWETITGVFLIKKRSRPKVCVSVCECVWVLCLQSIYSFPQVQFMSGMWGINRNCICGYLLGGGYSISCTRVGVCVCCRRVNVHQSIQPCLQSLILVIYSEAEQGHAFETAPGEQIKGEGSSPSSWKISTPGTVTRTHSPDTILIWVHTQSSTRLRGFILSFAQMLISPLQSVRPASRHSDEYLWKSVCVCAFAFNYLSHWPL